MRVNYNKKLSALDSNGTNEKSLSCLNKAFSATNVLNYHSSIQQFIQSILRVHLTDNLFGQLATSCENYSATKEIGIYIITHQDYTIRSCAQVVVEKNNEDVIV